MPISQPPTRKVRFTLVLEIPQDMSDQALAENLADRFEDTGDDVDPNFTCTRLVESLKIVSPLRSSFCARIAADAVVADTVVTAELNVIVQYPWRGERGILRRRG